MSPAPPIVTPLQTAPAKPVETAQVKAPALVVDLSDPNAPTAAAAAAAAAANKAGTGNAANGDEQFAARVESAEPERARATMLRNQSTTISQGAVIPAVLETALNSDLRASRGRWSAAT